MKKIISYIALLIIIPFSILCFTGCNGKLIDWNYTYNWAIIEIGDKRVLHKIESWTDSDSESVMIRTACCDNEIWFSVNKGELYKNKPNSDLYDYEC